jgi:hypothetical protein
MRLRVSRATAAAAALVLLAGCGGDGESAAPRQPPASAAPSQAGHHATFTVPPAAPLRPGERFQVLKMTRPYTPKPPTNGSTDDYRCFLVDPHVTATTFLTGSQFLPQNADIVHHAIFFRVPAAQVAEARALDAAAPGDGWTCFGGTGIGGPRAQTRQLRNAPWVAAWAPGGRETVNVAGHRHADGGRQPARHAGALQPARDRREGDRHRPVRAAHPARAGQRQAAAAADEPAGRARGAAVPGASRMRSADWSVPVAFPAVASRL